MPTSTVNYGFSLPLVNDPVDEDLWGDELNANWTLVDTLLAALIPTGTILDYGGTTAPTGFLLCYGQNVSRATYDDLFAIVGTAFGAGDGVTTFAVPDLRGRVAAGKDDMGGSGANRMVDAAGSGVNGVLLGGSGGFEGHTLITAESPAHTHTGTTSSDGNHAHNVPAPADDYLGTGNIVTGSNATNTGYTVSTSTTGAHTHTFTTASTGGGGAHNNVQPTLILNKIIKT